MTTPRFVGSARLECYHTTTDPEARFQFLISRIPRDAQRWSVAVVIRDLARNLEQAAIDEKLSSSNFQAVARPP